MQTIDDDSLLCGQYKSAEGLAPITASGYERDLRLWIEYQGEIDILEIGAQHMKLLKDQRFALATGGRDVTKAQLHRKV